MPIWNAFFAARYGARPLHIASSKTRYFVAMLEIIEHKSKNHESTKPYRQIVVLVVWYLRLNIFCHNDVKIFSHDNLWTVPTQILETYIPEYDLLFRKWNRMKTHELRTIRNAIIRQLSQTYTNRVYSSSNCQNCLGKSNYLLYRNSSKVITQHSFVTRHFCILCGVPTRLCLINRGHIEQKCLMNWWFS